MVLGCDALERMALVLVPLLLLGPVLSVRQVETVSGLTDYQLDCPVESVTGGRLGY